MVLHLQRITHTVNLSPDADGLAVIPTRPKLSIHEGLQNWSSRDCQCSGLGKWSLGGWSVCCCALLLDTHGANRQWSMKIEWVKWKKGDDLTASAKECPEKLRLNGRDVYGLAFIHRLQTWRVSGKGNRIKLYLSVRSERHCPLFFNPYIAGCVETHPHFFL